MNISEKAKGIIDSCRFCFMCRHVCPIGNATGQERNTARGRAMGAALVVRNAISSKEIADNLYECALCGACTNNCITGWDPKVFVQELRTQIILEGVAPDYISKLIEKYQATGNIYGEKACSCLDNLYTKGSKIGLLVGQDALYKSPKSIIKVVELLDKAGVKVDLLKNQDSGYALWYLTGKTNETLTVAKAQAEQLNGYETIIAYDPQDLKLILQEYKEWGLEVKANVVSFNKFALNLIKEGKLAVKNNGKAYTLQDNFNYARDLDDSTTAREIISLVGVNKEMLLIGKETNMAGHLIMNEYMPNVISEVAKNRWLDAKNMDCYTLITESPAEYELLKANAPENCKVLSIEEMILENM